MTTRMPKDIASINHDGLRRFILVVFSTVAFPFFGITILLYIISRGVKALIEEIIDSSEYSFYEFIKLSHLVRRVWRGSTSSTTN